MRSLEREADADNYIGHQYTWVGFDQLETWPTQNAYIKMIGCLRSPYGVPVKRIRSSANPGGIGHVWVKQRFVAPCKTGWKPLYDEQTKMTRMFIPSVLTDNKILLDNDPYYADRLRAMSGVSQALVEAWLNGDWDVVAGAYFDTFGRHLVHPHYKVMEMIQPWAPRWLGIDWGFKHSTTCYWNAQEGVKTITYDEFVTSGQSPKDLAEQIGARCQGQKIDEIHLSHDAFAKKTDADSIAEQMAEEFERWGLPAPERSSTDRIGGAQLLYKLFKLGLVVISDKCSTLIDTVPAIIHDPDHQEQTLKMEGDDSYDGYRYGIYGRLGPKPKPVELMMQEAVTSADPTVRHIQALLAQQKYRQSETVGVQTFSRKIPARRQ